LMFERTDARFELSLTRGALLSADAAFNRAHGGHDPVVKTVRIYRRPQARCRARGRAEHLTRTSELRHVGQHDLDLAALHRDPRLAFMGKLADEIAHLLPDLVHRRRRGEYHGQLALGRTDLTAHPQERSGKRLALARLGSDVHGAQRTARLDDALVELRDELVAQLVDTLLG